MTEAVARNCLTNVRNKADGVVDLSNGDLRIAHHNSPLRGVATQLTGCYIPLRDEGVEAERTG